MRKSSTDIKKSEDTICWRCCIWSWSRSWRWSWIRSKWNWHYKRTNSKILFFCAKFYKQNKALPPIFSTPGK
jgi:hypothetical protein